jgi:hypothetical protein
MMLEFDLAGAEWVVVAYLSGDANMLGVVASGKSPHVVTGSLITSVPEDLVTQEHKVVGSKTDENTIRELREAKLPHLIDMHEKGLIFLPRVMSIRQAGKKSNHGLNYNMKYRRFALENEISEADAMPLVEAYTTVAYPGIPLWHESIRQEMRDNNRTMVNCFGRKVRLLGEWGSELFDQAYSFKPQSTVADSCLQAMCRVYENESEAFCKVRLGAQVHDSLMIMHPIPADRQGWVELAQTVHIIAQDYMRPLLTYGGREFRLGCDLKLGLDWGHMKECTIQDDPEDTADFLMIGVGAALEAAAAAVATPEILPDPGLEPDWLPMISQEPLSPL